MQRHPAAGRSLTFDRFAQAPHLGTAGLVGLPLFAAAVLVAERLHRIPFDAAAFLVAAGLTGDLFARSLYDFTITLLRLRFRPSAGQNGSRHSGCFHKEMSSTLLECRA